MLVFDGKRPFLTTNFIFQAHAIEDYYLILIVALKYWMTRMKALVTKEALLPKILICFFIWARPMN